MSKKKRKKSVGGASGSSSLKRKQAAKVEKRNVKRDRILAFLIAIGLWAAIIVAWRLYDQSQFEKRQGAAKATQTHLFLKQISNALTVYKEETGRAVPRSTDPMMGGAVLFRRLSMPREDEASPVLPVWAGQIAKIGEGEEQQSTLTDAWGDPIHYRAPGIAGAPYDLWSTGGNPAFPESQWIRVRPAP